MSHPSPTVELEAYPGFRRPDADREPLRFVDLPDDVRAAELDRVCAETALEKQWYAGRPDLLLHDKSGVVRAIGRGTLGLVPFTDDGRYSPVFGDFLRRQTIAQVRELAETAEHNEVSVPYLRPYALELLGDVCNDAYAAAMRRADVQDHMAREGIRRFQYAVTSMARTVLYQSFIASNGVLAVSPGENAGYSSHNYGGAFDIDHSGIYVELADGRRMSSGIGRRERLYIPGAVDALADTLELYRAAGDVSAICEVPQARGCYHVAVKPGA